MLHDQVARSVRSLPHVYAPIHASTRYWPVPRLVCRRRHPAGAQHQSTFPPAAPYPWRRRTLSPSPAGAPARAPVQNPHHASRSTWRSPRSAAAVGPVIGRLQSHAVGMGSQMNKRMLRRRKIMLFGAAAFVAASLVAFYVQSRLRKRRKPITYQDHPMVPMDANFLNDDSDGDEEITSSFTNADGASSVSKAPKRAKIASDGDMLISSIARSLDNLASVIEKVCTADTDVPKDLWDNMKDLSGFEEAHLAHYYAHLCENVPLARAFNKLSVSNKMIWVARYIKNHI